jgi:hypothetical protein
MADQGDSITGNPRKGDGKISLERKYLGGYILWKDYLMR